MYNGKWNGNFILDDSPVYFITPYLTAGESSINSHPKHLLINENIAFMGVQTGGMGFILNHDDATALINNNIKNTDVLFPYLTGKEINLHPQHKPKRWAINFWDWPLNSSSGLNNLINCAADYPDCLKIIESKVKPERQNNNRQLYRERWWQYSEKRPALYSAVKNLNRVLCLSTQATKYLLFAWINSKMVFSYSVAVFATESNGVSLVLHSSFHDIWVRFFTSNNLSLIRYTIANCFENFPFPFNPHSKYACPILENLGLIYHDYRQQIMNHRNEGLTSIYNHFHDPKETTTDIKKLRDLHVEMDEAVAAAYEWQDLKLEHGFHDTKQGLRYTLSDAARREVLDRLLRLNHERYAEEVRQGLHDKKGGKGKVPRDEAPDAEDFSLEAGGAGTRKRGRKGK